MEIIKDGHVEQQLVALASMHMHLHDCEMLLCVEFVADTNWPTIREAIFKAQERINRKMQYWEQYEPTDIDALAKLNAEPGIDDRNATNT